jgi:hypothetical protein
MGKYRLFKLKSYQRSIGKDFDWIADNVVFKFGLYLKTRKQDKIDKVHFFLIFWKENQKKFIKYSSYESIAFLLRVDHSSIVHYVGKTKEGRLNRKKSVCWKENIAEIKNYILEATTKNKS